MRILYLHIFLFSFLLGNSQNLVPNPSFETYTVCPSFPGQIEYAVPWTAATINSSTDYFNVCSGSSNVGVPYNQGGGFQYPRTGNAYAGLFFTVGVSGREYLQVQLTSPLVHNITYYVEFYVNLVNLQNETWNSSCNNIAANFSVTRPYTSGGILILQALTPHIMLPGNPVITDTLNWVKVSGCYTAEGEEEYLTIGNFFDSANTIVIGTATSSYYFVDDVRVEEIIGACVTGVEEQSFLSEVVRVYPNPANDLVIISSKYEMQKVEFSTITGQLLLSEPVNQTSHQLQLQNFAEGIYFVKVVYANGMSVAKKVIKQ